MIKILYKILLLAIFTVTTVNCIFSQEDVKIRKSEFRENKDGFKEAWKLIKKANSLYEDGAYQYRNARELYLKANNYNDKNPELNYKIGVTYLYADDKFQAIKYLKIAYDLDHDVTEDIHFQMARAYHMNQEFDNAIKEYKIYQSKISERKLKKMNLNIPAYIEDCETGKELVAHPVRVVVQNLGKMVNSEYDDYLPVIDSKEETMYYTTRRPSKINKERNYMDKKFSEDIFISKKKNKEWGIGQILSKTINTKKSDAAVALSPDDKRLYIYKNDNGGDIYYTELKNGKWKSPKPFKAVNSKSRETSVSFTGDGKRVYFVSDRQDMTIGGKDIYYCDLNEKGKWSKPKNVGFPINTTKNEEAVSISRDGKTMYFSSKGHPGMGGYDIFVSHLENGSWTKPENMGYPINTPDDDLFFKMMDNGKTAYLSSIREQGIGEKDIYKVIFLGEEKDVVVTTENSPLAYEMYDIKTLFRKLPEQLSIDSSFILLGRVLDSETKKPIVAKLQFIDSEKSKVAAVLVSDSSGNYKARLPEKKTYGIEITAKGYLFYLDVINLSKETTDEVTKDFTLQALEVGAKVVMKNIFFETGKSTLKDESYAQLNNVIEFMKDNPSLKLEISGHSDNVGSVSSNMKLSQARAKAVVDYMVIQGINTDRLTFKGYGPSQPIAPNTTVEGKAQNRRVEFKITGK